jgi:hypothetical protein
VTARWRRFNSLSVVDRRLIVEAALLLFIVSIGLRLCRFQRLRNILAWLGGLSGQPDKQSVVPVSHIADRIAWAITAIAKDWPRSMTCLVRALAAESMLRRRGIASDLRFGVRNEGDGADPFSAHAWLECDGLAVMGGLDDLSDYHVLTAPARFSRSGLVAEGPDPWHPKP